VIAAKQANFIAFYVNVIEGIVENLFSKYILTCQPPSGSIIEDDTVEHRSAVVVLLVEVCEDV